MALLRLLPGSMDTVVFLLRLLRLVVVRLVSVGVDLLRPVPDLLPLLRLALLPVTVDFPEVKSTPNPLCFDSRVWSCPLLVLISACGMIVGSMMLV